MYESRKVIETVCTLNGKLYCISHSLNGSTREIYVIDAKTLEREKTLVFIDEVAGLLNYEGSLYCGIGNKFCLISLEDGSILDTLCEQLYF